MMTTSEGLSKLQEEKATLTSELPWTAGQKERMARTIVRYHYMHLWEVANDHTHPCPLILITEGIGGTPLENPILDVSKMQPECFMCWNGMFDEAEQEDDELGFGFRMYDGIRGELFDCDEDSVSYVLLPDNSEPDPAPSINFEFDLNPNNNEEEENAPIPVQANFASFEIFIDEEEEFIQDYVSSTPPSGNRSLKVNNNHNGWHINKMEKGFTLHPDDTSFFYWDAVILQDPNHPQEAQPFSKVVLRKGEDILYETCLTADVSDPLLSYINVPGQSKTILFRDWTCHEVKLGPFIDAGLIKVGDYLTAEFIAADCGWGAHWGYMYVADICLECFKIEVELQRSCKYCPELPVEFCGSYCIEDKSGNLSISDREFNVVNDQGITVFSGTITNFTETTVNDVITGNFCFEITADDYALIGDGCFDVYADITLSNGYTRRSLSVNPNTEFVQTNDLYFDASCYDNEGGVVTSNTGFSVSNCPFYTEGFTCPNGLNGAPGTAGSNMSLLSSSLVNLYPNPASEQITIDFTSGDFEIKSMMVFDRMGNPMNSSTSQNGNTISISQLTPGEYKVLIELKDDKGIIQKSFVVN